MGKAKVQTIENKKPSDTLGNRLSTTRTEIVCALEFYLVKRLDDKSRMKREFHVRFCENLRGKYFGLLDFKDHFYIKVQCVVRVHRISASVN
jgi:hypothetical protein